MRNLSLQTDFRASVPYKKGDDLEFSWLLSGDSPRSVALDIESIKNSLDIEHIYLDDTEIRESDLSRIQVQDTSLLKIIGKARRQNSEDTFVEAKIISTTEINTGKTLPVALTGSKTPL